MKRSIFTLFVIALLAIVQTDAFATIRRVGFKQSLSPVNGLDYTTFQAAHDAAVTGDTIQLYPSTESYAGYSGSIIKRLVILGPGYFYNNNTYNTPSGAISNGSLQLLPGSLYSNYFTVGVGSAGTVFQGINHLQITTSNTLDSLNDILISRCRNVNVTFDNSGVCNNWIISQCYAARVAQSGYGISFSANRTITNLRIENTVGPSISYSASGTQSPVGVNSGQILNCIFYSSNTTGVEGGYTGSLQLNNSTFVIQNCIDGMSFFSTSYMSGVSNSIFVNNLTTASPVNNPVSTNPGSSGNVFNINPAGNSIFVGVPNNVSGGQVLYSSDGAWQLSATSPAKSAGIIPGTNTPTDCGIFGGTNPYKASGIPAVPSFYKLNAPSSTATTNPYIMTFSVRSNN